MKINLGIRGGALSLTPSTGLAGVLAFAAFLGTARGEAGPVAVSAAGEQFTFAAGAPAPTSTEFLDRVILSASRVYNDLISFVCREQIERFRGNSRSPQGRKVDVITSTVSYDSDAEHYSDIYLNNKPLNQIRGLSGAWSEGDYGTLLGETLKALKSKPVRFISFGTLDGVSAAVYRFDYSTDDSPWEMEVSGRHYFLPFKGQIWVSPTTGDVLRVDRIADEVPNATGIAGVNWSVSFGAQPGPEGTSFRLPTKAVYSVSYLDTGRHEWNLIAFSGYKRYGAEVVVHFQ
jgi:hypothetical protein